MLKKGISPLIATALTLVITIGLAAILISNFTSFSEKSGEELQVQNKNTLDCSFAAIRIDSVVVNKTTNQVTMAVSNIGKDDIAVSGASIFDIDGTSCKVWNETLLGKSDTNARTVTCTIFSDCSDISHARVDTTCNGVSATAKDSIVCE